MSIEMPKLITPPVRLSWAALLSPKENTNDNGETKLQYSAALLFPKDPAAEYARLGLPAVLAEQYAARMEVLFKGVMIKAVEYYGKDKIPPGIRNRDLGKGSGWPFRDQGQKDDDGYTPGALFLNVSTIRKPQIVDRARQPLTDPEKVYSGAWAICSLNAYGYKAKGNTGIGLGLNNVQIVADDERFGGGSSAESDFNNDIFGGSVDLSDLGIG